MSEFLKNAAPESTEQESNKEEQRKLMSDMCKKLELEPSEKYIDFIERILGAESKRQELLRHRDEQIELTDSMDKSNPRFRDSVWDEWNADYNAERVRRTSCNLIAEILEEKQGTVLQNVSAEEKWLAEEDYRRKILALPEVEELGKSDERFASSYCKYQNPTREDIKSALFEEYYSSRC